MDSFTLGPTPKIDFTQTTEHTLATAWELADLWFSLNTLSKHYGIHCWIMYKTLAWGPLFIGFKRPQKLLRFRIWLASVRTEVSLAWTVFCDILSETAQFYLYQVYVWTVFTKILSAFERNSGIFWNTRHRSGMLPRRPNGLQRLPKQCRLLKSNSLLNTDWPSILTVLLWRPDGFIVICWTLRSIRTPSKAHSDGCTGTGCFCLEFCNDSSWTSLSNLGSVIVFDLIIVWIHEDSKLKTDHSVKTQPLHKVFLFYPECSQYKILTTLSKL